jgi:uncharacterized membrane protein YeaQ/YmgE (transglycosylase-associated protein family)
MTWTVTNLVIQITTGMVGGNLAAVLAKEHSFGALGHTIVGLSGGALSGYFLQILAGTVVTANGSVNEPTLVEQAILQGLTGAAAGAILVLVVGFVKHSIDQHRAGKTGH